MSFSGGGYRTVLTSGDDMIGQPLVCQTRHRDHVTFYEFWITNCVNSSLNGVVMVSPRLDDNLCLFEGIEHLAIQQFVPESNIERFAKAVVPGRVGFTV